MRNMSASVVSNNLVDLFGVLWYGQGSAETPWRWKGYRSSEEGMFSFRAAPFVVVQGLAPVVLVGGGIAVVAAVSCVAIADDVRDEVSERNAQTPQWPDKDKLLHCVATCLINLRAGIPCALIAAYSTERGGGGVQDPGDEQANLDGFECAQKIKWGRNRNPLHFSLLNDWQQCRWCCRQKGYRLR
ncbi:MAG: hypothetical protein KatS3mg023_1193 [Armatimonadota bacterium]|nr:MAG: hypothetical protein KatS3mg023_1193 [Armatimonadota bacterium]